MEIEDGWTLLKGEDDGYPFFMLVNDSLKAFNQKSQFPMCLIASIHLADLQDYELPTDSEAEVLNDLEDKMIEVLSKEVDPILIGRETYRGIREILIYIRELSNFKSLMDSLSAELNKIRRVELQLLSDKSWGKAKRYLGE